MGSRYFSRYIPKFVRHENVPRRLEKEMYVRETRIFGNGSRYNNLAVEFQRAYHPTMFLCSLVCAARRPMWVESMFF